VNSAIEFTGTTVGQLVVACEGRGWQQASGRSLGVQVVVS